MKLHRKLFLKEIRHHYSDRYMITLLTIVLIILIPVFVVIFTTKVRFDPAEFINLYLSTILTSLLIAFALQGLEIYRLSHQKYFKLLEILSQFENLLNQIGNGLPNDELLYGSYVALLEHYKSQLLQNLVSDMSTNETIIQIHNSQELSFVIANLNTPNIVAIGTIRDIESNAKKLLVLVKNFKGLIYE